MRHKVKETRIPRMEDKTEWEELSGISQSSKRTWKKEEESLFGEVIAENFPNSWKNVNHEPGSLTQSKQHGSSKQSRKADSGLLNAAAEAERRRKDGARAASPGVTFMSTAWRPPKEALTSSRRKCEGAQFWRKNVIPAEKGVSNVHHEMARRSLAT